MGKHPPTPNKDTGTHQLVSHFPFYFFSKTCKKQYQGGNPPSGPWKGLTPQNPIQDTASTSGPFPLRGRLFHTYTPTHTCTHVHTHALGIA